MTTTYGFKAMNADMTCRDYQFELGKTYQIDNKMPLKLCSEAGFHFCLNFEDVFNYYNWPTSRVFKIKTEAKVLTEDNKSITKEITILEEVTIEEINLKESKNKYTKLFVINKITDENLVFDTFKDDKDWEVREAVVQKLSDKKLIFETFKGDEDPCVREAVVQKLSDKKLIYDTFKDDKKWFVRKAVVKKLSDEKFISCFKDDEDCDVRKAVIKKLEELRSSH